MASASEIIAHQLKNLGMELGQDDLSLAEGRSVNLALDTGLAVSMEWDAESEQLVIFSALREVPRDSSEKLDLFQKLLEFNCMQLGSLGGVLSYHPPVNAVLYHMRVSFTSDVEQDALKKFVLDFASRATVIDAELGRSAAPVGGGSDVVSGPAEHIRA